MLLLLDSSDLVCDQKAAGKISLNENLLLSSIVGFIDYFVQSFLQEGTDLHVAMATLGITSFL